eukprot:2166109-Pyramimonas_sp.AAC.1
MRIYPLLAYDWWQDLARAAAVRDGYGGHGGGASEVGRAGAHHAGMLGLHLCGHPQRHVRAKKGGNEKRKEIKE